MVLHFAFITVSANEWNLSPIGYDSARSGTIVIDNDDKRFPVEINDSSLAIEGRESLELPAGVYVVEGTDRGKEVRDTVILEDGKRENYKFQNRVSNIVFTLSGGSFYYFNHNDTSLIGASVEAGLVLESLVYVTLEPALLFNNDSDGAGLFLNIGRVFYLTDVILLKAGGGFGLLKCSFPIQKHRYYCQAKGALEIGKGRVRGAFNYALMAGTAVGHRIGVTAVADIIRRTP